MTLSFVEPNPEDRKVLTFARDIRLGLLRATVLIQPDWLTPADVEVPQEAEMKALLARLVPIYPHIPPNTPRTERVSVPLASLASLSLVHTLMISLFLAPATACNMMHKKADAMGMNQHVAPFLDWLRVTTIEPLQGVAALTSVELTDAMMAQQQGIMTSLVPTPPSL